MAPTKSPKGSSKGKAKSAGVRQSKKSTGSAPAGISKRKQKSLALAKPGGAQKTKSKSLSSSSTTKKKRVYTEKELDIPKLNGIVPAGIVKPKGQKKGKKFVDDPESLIAIMSVVNAEKEGRIESKIMRARQLEEVREAKRKEAEKRGEEKAAKFEDTKKGLKKRRKSKHEDVEDVDNEAPAEKPKKQRKRVSFG
ncbi:hypothetical protein EJ04DRAFT_10557 [Polyplosphaeria fusca]|uniref:60S ribosomal subunit assembly/export protein LOC1 n=1 Tax=Polyplosphaeria fusca TaxID=682080 RepID=A0A9P4QU94_9PLEO|nr:hypothetical protein EJ04DRAFT_10557 [Polyplosphaeria fusca]